ncbi:hypothetical protein Q5P01_021164 [Channa striata]|uniref:Uncharacterized protein n=1 Tax=Channa striata TaxID=64152 RepID=A0AA88S901_CHASR|nr:hypothetical protein Q5P01_021164 [Channa striata]
MNACRSRGRLKGGGCMCVERTSQSTEVQLRGRDRRQGSVNKPQEQHTHVQIHRISCSCCTEDGTSNTWEGSRFPPQEYIRRDCPSDLSKLQ